MEQALVELAGHRETDSGKYTHPCVSAVMPNSWRTAVVQVDAVALRRDQAWEAGVVWEEGKSHPGSAVKRRVVSIMQIRMSEQSRERQWETASAKALGQGSESQRREAVSERLGRQT